MGDRKSVDKILIFPTLMQMVLGGLDCIALGMEGRIYSTPKEYIYIPFLGNDKMSVHIDQKKAFFSIQVEEEPRMGKKD